MSEFRVQLDLNVRDYTAMQGNFLAIDEAIRKESKKLMRKYGTYIQHRTSVFAPRDTGFMSENVRLQFTKTSLQFEVGWRAEDFYEDISPRTWQPRRFYAPWQEFGTSRQQAHPSLVPAYDYYRPILVAEMKALFKGIGKRVKVK